MKNPIIQLHKKIIYGYKSSSKSYIKHLRKKGITVGQNVTFYEPYTNCIDTQAPFLIQIGNNVEITRGVIILTHDYSWAVLKQKYGEIIGARRKVHIGNNVFIGMDSIILNGVTINDNVIVGANSVVTNDLPGNAVYCGVPARRICSLEEYYRKRIQQYEQDAIELFQEYQLRNHKIPPKTIFHEFFWLFEERNIPKLPKIFIEKIHLTGNYETTKEQFLHSKPKYNGYEAFVKHCLEQKGDHK